MYLEAVAVPLLATPIAFGVQGILHTANVSLVYLTAVLAVAVRTSTRPALFCAVVSFFAYNFFFTEPKLTLFMMHREDALTVTFFLLMAAVTGQLAARLRNQLDALRGRDEITRTQFQLSERLTTAIDKSEIIGALCDALRETIASECRVHEVDEQTGEFDCEPQGEADRRAMQAALRTGRPAGRFSETESGAQRLYVQVHDGQRAVAVVAIALKEDQMSDSAQSAFAEALAKQAGLALGRTRLTGDLEKERVEKEREILRSSLLSSVSHDLRSPLAAMIGATTSLLELDEALTPEQKKELLESMLQESRRLDRYIQNLLDMTRLGSGELKLERDWVDLKEIISVTKRRIQPLLGLRTLDIHLDDDLPLLFVHGALVEQVIFNLADNAIKFSPDGSPIKIAAYHAEGGVFIDVIDRGIGIAPKDRTRIFERFYSARFGDRRNTGTGLGLAICQGVVGAHGGLIRALDGEGGVGTTMRVFLPASKEPPVSEEPE